MLGTIDFCLIIDLYLTLTLNQPHISVLVLLLNASYHQLIQFLVPFVFPKIFCISLQVCTESLCVKHGLQQCDCPGDSMKEKCHMCCQQPGNYRPLCPLLLRNVFTLCVSTRQPVSVWTEVTFIHCFPLGKLPQKTPSNMGACAQSIT